MCFGLIIGFIDHLLLETTNQYNTLAGFHNTLFCLFPLVFTIRFLATDLSQEQSLQITMKSSCHFLSSHLGLPTLRKSILFSNSNSLTPLAQSHSYVTTDGQLASLSWNKAPIWGLRTDLYYCQTVAGLLMWGSLSDERTGQSFASVTVSSNKSVVSTYNLHLHVINCMYIRYTSIQTLCQSRLSNTSSYKQILVI
jgi:hypothetical protein